MTGLEMPHRLGGDLGVADRDQRAAEAAGARYSRVIQVHSAAAARQK